MNISFRPSELGRKSKVLLALLGAVLLLIVLFDWNWFRQPLERYLTRRAHREVNIGDLHVRLGLESTVRLRRVHVENAAWAQKQPMADIGEVSFTFPFRSLWERPWIVSRLVLSDGTVNLEKLADGHRNWRLRNPDDTGPGRVKVLTVEPHRAKIAFIEHRLGLDIVVTASAVSPGERNSTGQALATRLNFAGTYRNAAFSGSALTGDLLSFQESGRRFPVRGHLEWGEGSRKTRVEADGVAADVVKQPAIDAQITVAGPSLADLYPFLPSPLLASHPYRVTARLTTRENKYTVAQLRGKIGETDVAGDASYGSEGERRMLSANLRSELLDFADLGPAIGVRKPSAAATKTRVSETASPQAPKPTEPHHPDRALPDGPVDAERLKATEAHVEYQAKTVKAPGSLAVESLRFNADLKGGILDLKPFDVGVAGGHIAGALTLDAREDPMAANAVVDFRGIRLEKLLPTASAVQKGAGAIGAHFELSGRGRSVADLVGSSSGSFTLAMEGGHISNLLDAETSLNGGKILGALLGGDKDVAIRCAALAIDFRDGVGRSRTVLFDTEQTRTDGSGTIDLRDETFDFMLRPTPKHPAILSLRAPVRLYGSFKHVQFSVDKRVVLARAGGAALLAAINPFAVFLPLIETGSAKDGQCAAVLGSMPSAEADEKAGARATPAPLPSVDRGTH